ncbi:peptidase inhibitor family I36 protein [Micromonospora sp. NPDC049102]|uniref:peptidase inhibitor family I36 protein n=1 Tax=Micromonospora sp. NPDC049102 TaxID=3364265 RepID=UPI0037236827
MKRNRVLGSLVAGVVATAGTLVAATPAQAVYQCRSDEVCFYEHSGETGSVAVLASLSPRHGGGYPNAVLDFRQGLYTNGKNLNDSASSVVNNTDFYLSVYENVGGASPGKWVYVRPRAWGNLVEMNDMASAAALSCDPKQSTCESE